MSLKRSTGVRDLSLLPPTLNFELHAWVILRAVPNSPAMPVVFDSLRTVKQVKYSLRHLLPVDPEDPRLVWTVVPAVNRCANADKEYEARMCEARDSGMDLASVSHGSGNGEGEHNDKCCRQDSQAEPTVLTVANNVDAIYEVLKDGDSLVVDFVPSDSTSRQVEA